MNKSLIKSLILALALAIAIGGVLFFIQTVVSPPENIKVEDVHTSDIQKVSNSYNPDTLGLVDAEKRFDAIVDRATIYKDDSFIDQKEYDKVISASAEKFSAKFVSWAMSRFDQATWNHSDHAVMVKMIYKLRNVTVAQDSRKALETNTLASLTKIESIIGEYNEAWKVAKQTSFSNYDDAYSKRTNAERLAKKEYLRNCVSLVNSLNSVGSKLENSCYYQLRRHVGKLQSLYSFGSKDAYDNESSRVYDLIQKFEKAKVFGVSTSAHVRELKNLQDYYDRAAENHEWSE